MIPLLRLFNKNLVTMIKCAIFVAKFIIVKEMALYRHIRIVVVALLVMTVVAVSAQSKGDITARINRKANVSVKAPAGLATRSNNELNSDNTSKRSSKNDEVDATNLDDVKDKKEDKKDDKREENRPPKRSHTTQQSIQARGVGYRIQAFSANNSNNGKVQAQQRARAIAMRFPQYRSYISYNAPSWRLRIGDFKSQEDAQKALQRVRAAFPAYGREMIIVRDRINVWGN